MNNLQAMTLQSFSHLIASIHQNHHENLEEMDLQHQRLLVFSIVFQGKGKKCFRLFLFRRLLVYIETYPSKSETAGTFMI